MVLAAAVFHALWNRLLHGTADRVGAAAVAGLASAALLLPALLAAPPRGVLPAILLSGLAETAYALCLSAAYRRGALSLAYPLGRGTAPLLVTLGGWLAFADRPAPATAAAAVALGAGLALVATARRHRGQRGAAAFALLTGACIASYSLIDAHAVRQVSPAGYLAAVMALQGCLLAGGLRSAVRLRAALRPGLLIGAGSIAAYLLVLLAFQRAGAARVATLREVSVLLGVLLSGERPGRQVWAGAALVVAGAILAAR